MNFAVIFDYSFDDDVSVYLFEEEADAVAFLRSSYEEELRFDIDENGWDTDGCISDDGWYAKITNHFPDGDDVTKLRIGSIYQ